MDPKKKSLDRQVSSLSASTKLLERPLQHRNLTLLTKSLNRYSVGTFRNAWISPADARISWTTAGLVVYINGYTGPKVTDRELKRLISVHGGEIR